MSAEEVLFRKEVYFHEDSEIKMNKKQSKILEALELLHPNYSIKRKIAWGTSTPVWEITVYKK